MFGQAPPPPEFFDQDHLPSFILGVVVFGASAVGVAVTGGELLSALILAVLSASCAAVALLDRRYTVPAPPSSLPDADDQFDWESFTQQFWAHVREHEASVATGRRGPVRVLRGVPARWKRRQRPVVRP
jgi:hypothetical protein